MARLEAATGGTLGIGGTVAVREIYDHNGGLYGAAGSIMDRLTRPSVVFGVGSGLVASGLWYLDDQNIMDTTPFGVSNDLWGVYGLTATASGAGSALVPASTSSSSASTSTATAEMTNSANAYQDQSSSQSSQSNTNSSNYAAAGGDMAEATAD